MTTTSLIAAADGRRVHFRALGTRYVVTADATAGAFAIVEHDLAPHALGSPLHTHEREDEISHVTSGRLGVQIGDEVLHAAPGDTVVKPRGIAHAFWNPGDEPVRFLEVITPAGFEDYFAEVEPLLSGPARRTRRRWATAGRGPRAHCACGVTPCSRHDGQTPTSGKCPKRGAWPVISVTASRTRRASSCSMGRNAWQRLHRTYSASVGPASA
jgi:quercetin dioxygenase-like cupin family protein